MTKMSKELQTLIKQFANNKYIILFANGVEIRDADTIGFDKISDNLNVFDADDNLIASVDASELYDLHVYLIPDEMPEFDLSKQELMKTFDYSKIDDFANLRIYKENEKWCNTLTVEKQEL